MDIEDFIVVALADLEVKRHRIQGALAKINIFKNKVNQSIRSVLVTYLKPLLLNELKYPPRRIEKFLIIQKES